MPQAYDVLKGLFMKQPPNQGPGGGGYNPNGPIEDYSGMPGGFSNPATVSDPNNFYGGGFNERPYAPGYMPGSRPPGRPDMYQQQRMLQQHQDQMRAWRYANADRADIGRQWFGPFGGMAYPPLPPPMPRWYGGSMGYPQGRW